MVGIAVVVGEVVVGEVVVGEVVDGSVDVAPATAATIASRVGSTVVVGAVAGAVVTGDVVVAAALTAPAIGMTSRRPTDTRLGFAIWFAVTIAPTVTLNRFATQLRLSPLFST